MTWRLDLYSLSTVPVEQYFGETYLGSATAFIWQDDHGDFLVTNWHVVTCRNNETGECITSHGGEPDRLKALFRADRGSLETVSVEIKLRDEDGAPLWVHHAAYGRRVDVVAIPLSEHDIPSSFPINKFKETNLAVQVGMDVHILGYPFGAAPPSLPVWKRGSIASEPELVGVGESYYLVDSASRPGMSGSPVILRTYGTHLTEAGPVTTFEPATKFLGIYSGRFYTKNIEDAQLGRVWPKSLITEIVSANSRDPGER